MEVVSDSRNQISQVVHVIIVYRKKVLWKRKRFVINFSFLYENVEKKWRVRKITHSVKEIQTYILNSHIFHICKNLLIPAMSYKSCFQNGLIRTGSFTETLVLVTAAFPSRIMSGNDMAFPWYILSGPTKINFLLLWKTLPFLEAKTLALSTHPKQNKPDKSRCFVYHYN